MKLSDSESRNRIDAADHGVLSTVHPVRGVDVVPVVYSVAQDHLAVPIDRIKPKASGRLQRERNLADDPRAALLIEHWDRADWSRLWWARVELSWVSQPGRDLEIALTAVLRQRFPQYADAPFDRVLVFSIVGTSGWSATG